MRIISKKLASYLVAVILGMSSLSLPTAAAAAARATSYGYMGESLEPTGSEMMADAFLMRPFMLVSTVLTTVTFIITSPFSAMGGNFGDSYDALVKEPAAYTFTRPLGEM